jgi:hypothetical protein
MYVNGKTRSAETIPGMGGMGIKENGGGSEFNHNILQELFKMSQCTPRTTIKIL